MKKKKNELTSYSMIEEKEKPENNYFFKKDIVFKSETGMMFCFFIAICWLIINSCALYFIKGSFDFLTNSFKLTFFELELTLPLFLAGIVFQEVTKSILLIILANVKIKQQLIGFSISSFMPYVHSKFPIHLKFYKRIILFSSFSVMLSIFLCYLFDSYRFLFLTSFWMFFSGYDIYTIFLLRKFKQNYLAADHPEKPGAVIYDNPF